MINKKYIIRFIEVSLLFVLLFTNSFLNEKITVGNGAGWDGYRYDRICTDFSFSSMKSIDGYMFQRLLPFVAVHYSCEFFGLQQDTSAHSFVMCIFNLIAIIIAVYYFYLISNIFSFNTKFEIIAFSSFFYNYPILKMLGYYPILTDYFSFTIGIILFYYFFTKQRKKLLVVTIIGAFVWPTILLQGLFLIFLPGTPIKISKSLYQSHIKRILEYIIFIFPIIIYLLLTLSHLFIGKFNKVLFNVETNQDIIFISIFCTVLYYIFAFKGFIGNIIDITVNLIKLAKLAKIISFLICLIAVNSFIYAFSNHQAGHGFYQLFFEKISQSIQAPFSNIINHFAYYGPIFILIVPYYKCFWNYVLKFGYGYLLIIFMAFFFSIGNESRYLINFIPFIFFPLLTELSKININYFTASLWLIFSLILSRFWFSINVNGELVWNRYMLSQGPWQSFKFYLIFLFLFIFGYIIFTLLQRGVNNPKNNLKNKGDNYF